MSTIRKTAIVSFILILALVSNTFATSILSDVEDTIYEEPVTNLVLLNIMSGEPNNTFGINKKIKKAEMAKIIVKCMALGDVVSAYEGETKYADVPANHWASGYINIVSKLEIMDIEEGNYFYPDEYVTCAEAVTYCINMLGYKPMVKIKGKWPNNYLLKAIDLEILDGVKATSSEEITRGDFSMLLWNTMNTRMWIIVSTSNGTTTKEDKTLLQEKFPNAEVYHKKYKVNIIFDGIGGTVTADKTEVAEGQDVTITALKDYAYDIETLKINGKDLTRKLNGGKITTQCDGRDIQVEVKFKRLCNNDYRADGHEKYLKTYMTVNNPSKIDLKSHGVNLWCDECFWLVSTRTENHAIRKNIISVSDNEHKVEYICDICNLNHIATDKHVMENGVCLICDYGKLDENNSQAPVENDNAQNNDKNEEDVSENTEEKTDNKENMEKPTNNKENTDETENNGEKVDNEDNLQEELMNNEDAEKVSDDEENEEEIIEEIKTYTAKIIQTAGGKIKTNNITVEEGENQTFRFVPEDGYKIVDVKIDGKSVGAVTKYTINDVTATHEITATFEKMEDDFEKQFNDVKPNEWYYESVKFVTNKGLFNGTSNEEFAPNITMNRAMLVTVLYRLDGKRETEYENKFNDIVKGAYYEKAVIWATKNKIVSGLNDTEFAPTNPITREQLVVMLYRFAKFNKEDVDKKADLTFYEDYNEISEYAVEATAWAVKEGYITGRSENKLAPKETATRAEVATILMRFSKR